MRRYDWIAVILRQIYRGLLLTVASAAILMLCGCSPSADKQREMRSFVERYAREWQLGETEKIFQDFDPTFKKIYPTLEDCIQWKKSIDDQWGDLKGVEVVKINQLAFIRQPYLVETKMTYKGEAHLADSPLSSETILPVSQL